MSADELTGTSRSLAGQWPSTLVEIYDVLHELFTRRGRDGEDATGDAQAVVLELAQHFGGRSIYLPVGHQIRTALRDKEIFRLANGRNGVELSARYKLSVRMIQLIVARQALLSRRPHSTS